MSRIPATLVLVSCVVLSTACDSHRYHEEAQQYKAVAAVVLVDRGKCRAIKDCELIFFEAGDRVRINVYEVDSEAIAVDLNTRFRNRFHQQVAPQAVPVTLTILSSKHGEPQVMYRRFEMP